MTRRKKWTPVLLPNGDPCRHTPTDTDPDTSQVTCSGCGTTWANAQDWAAECVLTAAPPWINLVNTPPPPRITT